ncbi:unknown [Clostridium sp. CAG:921]|nr:unknown [Clostridium sp. CAG:921]
MDVKVNYPTNDNYINNIAYIKALFIKTQIENLEVEFEKKKEIYNKILDYLEKN